jgi:membrane protease YdiL (CAAX protease family)
MMQTKVSALAYFIFAFSWSCLFWLATVALGGIERFPGSLLLYFGGAGPFVAALTLIHFRESRLIQKDFWASTFDPRRMSGRWFLVALLIHPMLVLCAGLVDVSLGGELEMKTSNLTDSTAWITMIVFVFVFGPLPEEMGWRGVALDRLQAVMRPLNASILLGAAWSLWHVPLFLIEGTFQNQLGLGSPRFWIFLATMVPLSIIMTWVYNNTNRSILSAVLIHFTGNLCGALVAKTDQMAGLELAALTLAAIAVTIQSPKLGYHSGSCQRHE